MRNNLQPCHFRLKKEYVSGPDADVGRWPDGREREPHELLDQELMRWHGMQWSRRSGNKGQKGFLVGCRFVFGELSCAYLNFWSNFSPNRME